MMILFDTCVILGCLMRREPFAEDAKQLVKYVYNNKAEGFITVKSLMDIHYILKNRLHDEEKVRKMLIRFYLKYKRYIWSNKNY